MAKTLLSDKQRQRIQVRHKNSIELYGYQPQALFWSSREIQETRFDVLSEIFPEAHHSGHAWKILDVGCGFADFYRYLQKQGFTIEYTGIDLSEDMICGANCQNPGITLFHGDIFDQKFLDNQYDWVFLSGALNEVVETEIEGTANHQGRYSRAVIREMYRLARFGVAFNLLDARNQWIKERHDLQSFQPEEMANYCRKFARKVSMRDDYLDNDFSLFLYK